MCVLISKERYDEMMREWYAQGATLHIDCSDDVDIWIRKIIERLRESQ